MNSFTFTYSFSDAPEVFTTTIECESFADAFSLFYDRTTDAASDSVPMIHDIVMDSPADDYDRTMPECDDDPYYRECRSDSSGDDMSKADYMDMYSRMDREDW